MTPTARSPPPRTRGGAASRFNRRFDTDFAAAHDAIVAGPIGTPQLLRLLTRDPGISAEVAARVKPWTIFNETLIHDFDTLCWLNPGARVTEVYAQADALIHPQFADAGYLDTSMVQLRFDNGAFATRRPASRPSTATTSAARSSARRACCWPVVTRARGPAEHRTVRRRLRRAVRRLRRPTCSREPPLRLPVTTPVWRSKSPWPRPNPFAPVNRSRCPGRCGHEHSTLPSARRWSSPIRHRRPGPPDRRSRLRRRDLELPRQGPRRAGRHRRAVLVDDGLSARRPLRPRWGPRGGAYGRTGCRSGCDPRSSAAGGASGRIIDGQAARPSTAHR